MTYGQLGWLALVTMALLVTSACSPMFVDEINRVAQENGISESALVRRGLIGYAPRIVGDEMQIVAIGPDHASIRLTVVANHRPVTAGRAVLIAGGAAREEAAPCCGFFFGAAGSDIQEVVVKIPAGEFRGRMVDGLWLVVAPVDHIDPSTVEWQFIRSDGSVAQSGAGVLAPGS